MWYTCMLYIYTLCSIYRILDASTSKLALNWDVYSNWAVLAHSPMFFLPKSGKVVQILFLLMFESTFLVDRNDEIATLGGQREDS